MNNEYKTISVIYDFLLEPFIGAIRRSIVDEFASDKNLRILDMCGGTGKQLKRFSSAGFSDLHCLDASESMLRIAQRGKHSINMYHKNAEQTGFDDFFFDLVIISFAVHEKNRKTQKAILREAFRVLSRKGSLVIVDYVFDQKTLFIGKAMIGAVEFMAGGEHYQNFRDYLDNDGLTSLMQGDMFILKKNTRRAFNAVNISVFTKADPC